MPAKINAHVQIIILWSLHIFDAMFSGLGLQLGALSESNPLLAAAWELHPVSFFTTKFGLLLLATGIVIHHWRDLRMRLAVYVLNLVMLVVVFLEILHISHLQGAL